MKTFGSFLLIVAFVVGVVLFSIYGRCTHHENRDSIWWGERGKNLIPSTAVDLTLQQDFLDHDVLYTISDSDLHRFLKQQFPKSFEREEVNAADLGKRVGSLGWEMTDQSVVYTAYAQNGTAHYFYHDLKSGQTYQVSAYW